MLQEEEPRLKEEGKTQEIKEEKKQKDERRKRKNVLSWKLK